MNELLQRLDQDHRRLEQLLGLLEGLLDEFRDGLEPDYELMCELMEYLIDYADQVHHPSEDLIFARVLAQQGPGHALLQQLMQQHQGLGQLNRRFKESLEGIVHEAVLRREDVERRGRELITQLREHLRLEDEQAFPLALACLSAADWDELLAAAPDVQDPVFGQDDPLRFRAILRQLKGSQEA
ncbi:cation-binding protein [Lamprobacter modestohalophilus]|uniref:Cation-binding protein n=1 Tax=Lamprobacter modestohalophilus TaxID=1064514 RepID=A0A9X1B270_9GAMM|nr:hemerythrin domain-containing protein [Lamprobacter modestohalophilus]MBK1617068.1 cation-binding protein [Lamprobacter modestohalophilus]